MSKINREAAKDAAASARAMMAYGEGAGNQRKLVMTAVNYKIDHVPGYKEAFDKAYDGQDMVKIVKSAKRARRTADMSATAGRNVRAMARGDRRGMHPVLATALIVGAVAHQTGYDKKVIAYTKRKTGDVRNWLKRNL